MFIYICFLIHLHQIIFAKQDWQCEKCGLVNEIVRQRCKECLTLRIDIDFDNDEVKQEWLNDDEYYETKDNDIKGNQSTGITENMDQLEFTQHPPSQNNTQLFEFSQATHSDDEIVLNNNNDAKQRRKSVTIEDDASLMKRTSYKSIQHLKSLFKRVSVKEIETEPLAKAFFKQSIFNGNQLLEMDNVFLKNAINNIQMVEGKKSVLYNALTKYKNYKLKSAKLNIGE